VEVLLRLALFGFLLTCGGVAAGIASGAVAPDIGGMGYAGIAAGAMGLVLLGAGLAKPPAAPIPSILPEPAVLASVKARAASMGITLPKDEVLGPVVGHILNRKKMEAIKVLREATHGGLKDSKDAVDSISMVVREVVSQSTGR